MRWCGPSDGRRRAVESISSGVYGKRGGKNGAWSLPLPTLQSLSLSPPIEEFVGGSRPGQKSTVFPLVAHCFRSEVDRRPTGAHVAGNEVLRELRCHSEAGWPASGSGSGSSLTLTGRRGWVELELEPRGLAGLWLEQQGRPSSAEDVSAPTSCSRQNERGQKSQTDEDGTPQTLQSCHGHSQRPADRQRGHYGFKTRC